MEINKIIKADVSFRARKVFHDAFRDLLSNIIHNQFILGDTIDQRYIPPYDDIKYKWRSIFTSGFPLILYAWKHEHPMKIIVKRYSNSEENDSVTVEPLAPFKTKLNPASNAHVIDMAFYIECCLEITDHFVIYELKTIDKNEVLLTVAETPDSSNCDWTSENNDTTTLS